MRTNDWGFKNTAAARLTTSSWHGLVLTAGRSLMADATTAAAAEFLSSSRGWVLIKTKHNVRCWQQKRRSVAADAFSVDNNNCSTTTNNNDNNSSSFEDISDCKNCSWNDNNNNIDNSSSNNSSSDGNSNNIYSRSLEDSNYYNKSICRYNIYISSSLEDATTRTSTKLLNHFCSHFVFWWFFSNWGKNRWRKIFR